MSDKIDVIVPVYNEAKSIEEFYRRIRSIPLQYNLIFIDNASTDNTLEIIKGFMEVIVIEHDKNEGYGASIRDGIAYSEGDIIVIIDADCEYPPESIPELIKQLETSDVVYASRFLDRKKLNMPFLKILGNRIISSVFNFLFRQKVTDLYTGCKALRRSEVSGIQMQRKGFEHVLEMAAYLAKKGNAIDEIPITFEQRRTDKSKMKHLSETIKFAYLVVYYFFKPYSMIGK